MGLNKVNGQIIILDSQTERKTEKSLFLSIIIPIFNSAEYIEDCLDSCIRQNINLNEYEIICVDDRSTDDTRMILEKYAQNYPNIRLHYNPENKGVSFCRNIGIEMSVARYLWFVDSDDFIAINILSEIKNYCSRTNCDGLLFKGYYFNDQLNEDERKRYDSGDVFDYDRYRTEFCTHRLFKTKIIKENRLNFLEDVKYGEDQIFNCIYMKYTSDIKEYNRVLYFHRKHSDSEMNNVVVSSYISSIIIGADFLNRFAQNEVSDQKARTINYMLLRVSYAYMRISILPLFQTKQFLKMLSEHGYYPYKPPKDVVNKISRIKICKKSYYRRKRIKYIIQYKIVSRISHPLRTVSNIIQKLRG